MDLEVKVGNVYYRSNEPHLRILITKVTNRVSYRYLGDNYVFNDMFLPQRVQRHIKNKYWIRDEIAETKLGRYLLDLEAVSE